MVGLFVTECPANCRRCEDTESGTRCKVDGCDEGYAYNADDRTCQRYGLVSPADWIFCYFVAMLVSRPLLFAADFLSKS